jgi:phosphoribosylformylglycinamidine synthase
VPPASLADEGPVYARPMREPADLPLLRADRAETLPRPAGGESLRAALLQVVTSPDLCDRTWVTEQYDRYVLGNTVLAQPEDGGAVRLDEATGLSVALSVDGNGRYSRLDPYAGAQLALAEAYRNVVVTGATPVAVTNCLNFGSPEDPGVMWQFAEAVRGLADGCAQLGTPVTGGNVSFYNSTGPAAINPTPVVGVLGVTADATTRLSIGFRESGDVVLLLGRTREELSGSAWAWVAHGHLGGNPPAVDLAAEQRLAALIERANRVGHLRSAHDLSDGGLAEALVEACLRYRHGAAIAVPDEFEDDPFVLLFSESSGRALVSLPRGREVAFVGLCDEMGVPWTALGLVTGPEAPLEIAGQFQIPLEELRQAWAAPLPARYGTTVVAGAGDAAGEARVTGSGGTGGAGHTTTGDGKSGPEETVTAEPEPEAGGS